MKAYLLTFLFVQSDVSPHLPHVPSSSSNFNISLPTGMPSMLDGSNLLGPTASVTASSASLSLESRIQALFNINCAKSEVPAESKPTDAPQVNEPEVFSPKIVPAISSSPKVTPIVNSPAANPVRKV